MPAMPPQAPDAAAIARALAARKAFADIDASALMAMPMSGLAHAHWRLVGRRIVIRVPRAVDAALDARAGIERQTAIFRRAYPSGRTPRLIEVLPPSADLPLGALVVEEIAGALPRIPGEMAAIAESLATIHALGVPAPTARPPLADWPDHFAATLAIIERNAVHLARIDSDARRAIADELAWARGFARENAASLVRLPQSLVVVDAHPGNFIMTPAGAAMFVDLEKAGYGAPPVDLAHATLAIALAWSDGRATLTRADIVAFYRHYLDSRPRAVSAALTPWLMAFRRLVWLRTTMAFARFAAEGAAASLAPRAAANAVSAMRMAFDPAAIVHQRAEWSPADPLILA